MSIFSNDTEIDGRITAVETKTQNIQATSSKLTVNRSLELKLDEPDFFAIRSIDGFVNYLIFDDTIMNLYTNLNLNANDLSNVGSIKISSFENSNFFIKTDGTIDENDYIQATDTVITDLQAKTQNITANGTINTITKTSQFKLSNSQLFSITDDSGPFVSVRKFAVTNTKIDAEVPMSMNSYQLSGIPTPINDDQCPNKLYVDDLINPLQAKVQNISGFTEETQYNKNSTFILRNGVGDVVSIRDDQSNQLVISQLSASIFVPLFMQEQRIRDLGAPVANGDAVTKLYTDTTFVKTGAITAGSVPYFTATNTLSGASRNLFVQLGVSTIQSGIDAITFGGATGGSVEVSSGGSTENVICVKQNYTLVGAICPPFTQTTAI